MADDPLRARLVGTSFQPRAAAAAPRDDRRAARLLEELNTKGLGRAWARLGAQEQAAILALAAQQPSTDGLADFLARVKDVSFAQVAQFFGQQSLQGAPAEGGDLERSALARAFGPANLARFLHYRFGLAVAPTDAAPTARFAHNMGAVAAAHNLFVQNISRFSFAHLAFARYLGAEHYQYGTNLLFPFPSDLGAPRGQYAFIQTARRGEGGNRFVLAAADALALLYTLVQYTAINVWQNAVQGNLAPLQTLLMTARVQHSSAGRLSLVSEETISTRVKAA